MKSQNHVVATVARVSARHVAKARHDPCVYRHRQQSRLSTGAGECCRSGAGRDPESRIIAVSSFYRTPPLGPQDQPDYLNAAVVLETALTAETLLDNTQRIELQQGRVRKAERWGRGRWILISCCSATTLFPPSV
jgi:2-amino-4-hydroxy-6-hydroxymethyldihydropteridine diphosphokinase